MSDPIFASPVLNSFTRMVGADRNDPSPKAPQRAAPVPEPRPVLRLDDAGHLAAARTLGKERPHQPLVPDPNRFADRARAGVKKLYLARQGRP